ncbi:protein FAM83H [Sardina pilchardus]|uniref:protein FAM83H n=1 Tax=Sardina pilchardus TaxID=27697 RepID=UPI002E1344B0
MPHRSQSSSVGENPLDPNYLPPHYREEYRLAIDALVENGMEGYYEFLQSANVVDFLCQSEVEHIKNSMHSPETQQAPSGSLPQLTYHQADQDGSSDTYWPLHSDLDAPGLDLGWPQHSFVGPTEVTTLVNPSDPEMPSIKEQARRLIKSAQQVIAVVMDVFTDIDLFADLLDAAARGVPVYILLDEQNSHYFVSMVISCKVNLELIHMMRVRTVSGVTYFCRTGKSFKGQVTDRFLLTDCRAVLSGNYSFMWSFEKIHRCIAHLFLGELVATFDEEFRILFAQSQPLVVENALVPSDGSGYMGNQFGMKRTQSLRMQRGYFRQAEMSAYSFGDRMDSGLPFRREDPYRHTLEVGAAGLQMGKYSSQQFRMQQGVVQQGRSIMASQQIERNAFKRHSYAEGTQESYSSSRLYMKQRVMGNLDEMDQQYQREKHMYQAEGCYEQLRSRALQQDQHSDSGYPPELEPPSDYDALSSDDLKSGQSHPRAGHYDRTSHKRPTAGQTYACQNSPTQIHPPRLPGAKQELEAKDPDVKQGMRDWRISSYLSAYEDAGEECLNEPLGPDAFDEVQHHSDERGFENRERPSNPHRPKLDLRPRFGKPILQERKGSKDLSTTDFESKRRSTDSLSSLGTEGETEPRELGLTKHESFRNRINPMLQRSSRLRSSLIFSSSKLETHSTSGNTEEESDLIKTSSAVAEILEKRRSLSREPFNWSKHKKTHAADSDSKVVTLTDEPNKDPKEVAKTNKEESAITSIVEESEKPAKPEAKLNMNDPESRLLYFKELAAKRKAKTVESTTDKSNQPALKKSDLLNTDTTADKLPEVKPTKTEPQTDKPLVATLKPKPSELNIEKQIKNSITQNEENPDVKKDSAGAKTLKPFPSPKFFKKDPLKSFKTSSQSRRMSGDEDMQSDATDAEKSEIKKMRSQSSSSMSRAESRESLTRHGSNTSLNTEGQKDTKALDFLKKQTQRLKGILGPKGEKKTSGTLTSDSKSMKTVPEIKEETADKNSSDNLPENHKATTKPSQSRYQSSTSNVIFSSNLRDDTKVILEQISDNRQKKKQIDAAGTDEGSGDAGLASDLEQENALKYQVKNRFSRTPTNPEERENLLKRMESMRKEKKVYSRFEMGNNLG